MIRVLFVCLGNICRSPMAEFIMKKEIEERGIAASFEVASAGTSDEEEGNPVYPPARAELSRRGIDCSGKRARKISRADCAHFDYILCMEDWHVRSVLRLSSDRIMLLEKRVELFSLYSIQKKIAFSLLNDFDAEEGAVRLPFTKTAWAEYLNVSRTSLCRELKRMATDGLLEINGNAIRILRADLLEEALG